MSFQLYRAPSGRVFLESSGAPGGFRPAGKDFSFDALFTASDPQGYLAEIHAAAGNDASAPPFSPAADTPLLPPIGSQEVWAAGVTYYRSRSARMEEAESAGGDIFYDKVYEAERPELFFKSAPGKVRGHGAKVGIRADSTWDVPEPELTLALSSRGEIFGYTAGNDMSSRSIEGENPLYLPQAKVYTGSCALGPCLVVRDEPLPPDSEIRATIQRGGETAWSGSTAISQIKRSFGELAGFLFRSNAFPAGAYLMTGTGIVPDSDFTLAPGDEIAIAIDGIGELVNIVERV